MKKISSLIALGALLYSLFSPLGVQAAKPLSEADCQHPDGSLKVHYDTGTHWIVGNDTLQVGSDSVYHLDGNDYNQCFCPADVNQYGIQTKWMATDSLTQDQINSYLSTGWMLVQNGADFDLAAEPYLALNSNFQCNQGDVQGSAASASVCTDAMPAAPVIINSIRRTPTEATLTWTKSQGANGYSIVYGLTPNNYQFGASNIGDVDTYTVSNLDKNLTYYFAVVANDNCQPSQNSNEVAVSPKVIVAAQGEVLGVSTLASTGNVGLLAVPFILLGSVSLFFGLRLQKKH